MDQTTELRGPDLRIGVPAQIIEQDVPFVGQFRGEQVLVIRRADGLSAIGATCSHYGAPLDAGLLVGDQIRCPWHHAGFCIRDGRAERGPALADLPTYDVDESDGVVRVVGRRPSAAKKSVTSEIDVVIIGGGAAGLAAVETLRREGHRGAITLIDAEPDLPVDRPNLSKDYLAGDAPEEWLFPRDQAFYDELGVRRVHGVVTQIRPAQRRVVLKDEEVSYDALLLSPGAEPRTLAVPGADQQHVHTLRSLADCRGILATAEHATHAVVIGAGFLGLEAAGALRARGLDVHVVAPDTTPFLSTLGEGLGEAVVREHESAGVQFLLNRHVASIGEDAVELSDGRSVPAQLVLVAVGVTPRDQLAQAAGICVDKGIRVNAFLETDVPGIWAAGDAATWRSERFDTHLRSAHWVTAQRMGQAAALNMLGQRRPFNAVPFFWTVHGEMTINWVGYPVPFDECDVQGSIADHDCSVVYRQAGRVVAVATVGRDLDSLRAEVDLESELEPSSH